MDRQTHRHTDTLTEGKQYRQAASLSDVGAQVINYNTKVIIQRIILRMSSRRSAYISS